MKIKELKELLANADDNDNLEIIDGQLTLIKDRPQDITERIKTFMDAFNWCNENGKESLVDDFNGWPFEGEGVEDVIAYLKLRIIACALNEGWVPTFEEDETRYYPYSYTDTDNLGVVYESSVISFPSKLCFKSERHAKYVAKQFRDICADFCGVKKGDKE